MPFVDAVFVDVVFPEELADDVLVVLFAAELDVEFEVELATPTVFVLFGIVFVEPPPGYDGAGYERVFGIVIVGEPGDVFWDLLEHTRMIAALVFGPTTP